MGESVYNSLLYQVEEGVATIHLNRPDFYNAFNEEMSYELQDALKQVSRNQEVRVLVLGAEGKGFCSGQDLKEIAGSKNRSLSDSLYRRYNPIIKAMRNMPKPIIGKLQGVAAGAGCSLAFACDFLVATPKVSLVEIFINVGLVLDSGSSYFLPRLMSYHKAFELATMANKLTAEEAYAMGIINRLVSEEALEDEVSEVATQYAAAPTQAIGMIKKMLNKSTYSSLDDMLQYEAYCQEIAGRTQDYKEGVAAFNEKRKPQYKGL